MSEWVVHAYDFASGRPLWQHAVPARTGSIQARAGDSADCDVVTGGASRTFVLMTRCERGGIQLVSYEPRTLRRNWTRPVRTRHTNPDDGARFGFEEAPEGLVVTDVHNERFLFTEDGTPLPLSELPARDGRWSPPLRVGGPPDAEDTSGFDWNGAWPLPSFLTARDRETGRLGGFPLDRPRGHVLNFAGATSQLAFVHDDAQVTAFRPVWP